MQLKYGPGDTIPAQTCLNAKAAAAAESSDVLMPLVRVSIIGARIDSSVAVLSHVEYAPIVKQAETIPKDLVL